MTLSLIRNCSTHIFDCFMVFILCAWFVLSITNATTQSNSSTNPSLTHTTECLNLNTMQRCLTFAAAF